MEKKFELFWRGPFSQWSASPFVIDGIIYNTCEQWMMACKARLFNDEEILEKIMKENDPSKQKLLGKQVKNFKKELWEEIEPNGKPRCWNYVYKGNYAKVTQHPELKQFLLGTNSADIVEASPFDRIWGIGLGENDPKAQDKSQWRGTNWLGEILTTLRNNLLLSE